MIEKIVGKGSVLRVGAGIVYDNYGSAMVEDFATSGSPGLASTVAQPANTNFATSLRYGGSSLPALPALAGVSFNSTQLTRHRLSPAGLRHSRAYPAI